MMNSVVYTSEGRLNTKSRRQKELKKKSKNASAEVASYRSNTTKEELCHEYVTTLSSQFAEIHPSRKQLFLLAENEYGVKKFLPTSLRPTEVPFTELYDLHECALFFAGYIQYEPLDPPYEMPKSVFSPSQTLASHVGDCFDMSTLLASFLLGAGYDAYVVNGYAPKHITLKDQSMTECPMLSGPKEYPQVLLMIPDENEGNVNDSSNVELSYNIIDNAIKGSEYLKQTKLAEIEAAKDTFQLWIQEDMPTPRPTSAGTSGRTGNQADAEDSALRVHSWVLILPGRRDVKEAMFVEPSTGRVYSSSSSPYLGIESIWNPLNYWINLRVDKLLSDLTFDLTNGHIWECVFIEASNTRTKEGITQDYSSLPKSSEANIYYNGTANITISRSFDCPPSYVNAITFSRNEFLSRFPPSGKRSTKYFCCKVDYFARDINTQCMTMRITHYLDQACTIVREVHEWFEHRKDKLYKRSRFFLNDAHTIEYFHPGSIGEMRQWTEYPGKKIIIDFYVDGNLERIKRREEIIGERVVEHFEGRTDHLIGRICEFSTDKDAVGSRVFSLPGNGLSSELFIISMQQIYEKNLSNVTSPGSDVYTRTYTIPDGKLIVKYHFNTGSIANEIKTYYHTRVGLSNSAAYINELSLLQEIGLDETVEKLQEASALERECYTSIRSSFLMMADIIRKQHASEFKVHVLCERSAYERAIDKASELGNFNANQKSSSSKSSSNNHEKAADYLTPFMRHLANNDISSITREEALEIRQNCLDSMKARLIERANIIQSRLNDENAKLGRKQEQFQRSQREGDFSTEEYEKYCTEAMFRIQILEKRLVDHEETSLKKFAELDAKLATDPRLKVLRL
jgi:hypothetical protein